MQTFRFHMFVFLFALAVAGIAPADLRAQYLHPKITSKQTVIRNIIVLPAKVNVVRDSMKGPEGMAEESESLSARVEQMIGEVLASQQHLVALDRTTAKTADDAEQKYTVADIQTRFDDLLPK